MSGSVVPDDNVIDATDIEEEGQEQVDDNLVHATEIENVLSSSLENSIDDVDGHEASINDAFDPKPRRKS
jgi:hypothetical protein